MTGRHRGIAALLFLAVIGAAGGLLTGCSESPTQVASGEKPSSEFSFRLASAIQLDAIELAYDKASIEKGHPTTVTTANEPSSFAASIPIVMDRTKRSLRYVHLRAQVVSGQIGIGIYHRKANKFLVEHVVESTPKMEDVFLPLKSPVNADDVIIFNRGDAEPSRILIESVSVLARAKPITTTLSPNDMKRASSKASIVRADGVTTITTAPEPWAYAAALPLTIKDVSGPGLLLRVRARIVSGRIGFGILAPDKKSFSAEQMIGPSTDFVDVDLPVPATSPARDFIIRNTALENVRSEVIVKSLDLWQLE